MSDTNHREVAAALVRRWFDGSITNYQFDDEWPWKSQDKAVLEIGEELTTYYGDWSERPLITDTLGDAERDILERCQDFLMTDLPYEYEVFPPPKGALEQLRRAFRPQPLVITEDQKRYWPFRNIAERDRHRCLRPGAERTAASAKDNS